MSKKQVSQNKNSRKSATDNQWTSNSMNHVTDQREKHNKKSHE